jgi:hypothetical protein
VPPAGKRGSAGWADAVTDEVVTVEKPLDVLEDMLGVRDDEPSGTDERELQRRRRR